MPRKTPKLHQRQALQWSSGKSEIGLFMEMRLGKSLVALRWARRLRNANHHLIVCPLSVVPSWCAEFEDEGVEWFDISSWNKSAMNAVNAFRPGFYVTNYESLVKRLGKGRSVLSPLGAAPWDTAILDESPKIKSPRAQITKVLLKSFSPENKALLSGMPDPEGVMDFVTQMIWLHGSFMGCATFWAWRAKYCTPSYTGAFEPRRGVTAQVVEYVNEAAFVMTRKQAGMFDTKVRETRHVKVPAKIMKEIDRAINMYEVGDTHMTNSALAAFTWTQQLTSGVFDGYEHNAKAMEIVKLAKGELNGQSIVVFCRFNKQVEQIAKALTDAKISNVEVIGKTKDRVQKIKDFQAGHFTVLVAQTKCVKEGVDLSISSAFIYASNYHDYDIRAQSEDRGFHPEKRESILIMDIVAHDTPDEDIPLLMREKSLDARSFQRSFLSALKSRRVA